MLDVQDNVVGGLNQTDVDLLKLIANQVAIALRNARLFAEVEIALAEARATQEQYVKQSWDKTKIVTQRGQYHYTRAGLSSVDEITLTKAKRQALAQDGPAIVAINGHQPSKSEAQGPTAKTILSPITLHNKNIGTLQLHPASNDQTWTEDDLAIVQAVVDQFAQTAENLRLFDETRSRASREQTIREITDKLRAAPNLERLLEVATTELSQRLSAAHAELELGFEPEPKTYTQ